MRGRRRSSVRDCSRSSGGARGKKGRCRRSGARAPGMPIVIAWKDALAPTAACQLAECAVARAMQATCAPHTRGGGGAAVGPQGGAKDAAFSGTASRPHAVTPHQCLMRAPSNGGAIRTACTEAG